MRLRICAALWALFLSTGLACGDDPPIPSGNLARPSGLAYVPRDPDLASVSGSTVELLRSDILVADSEAQGVRIVQFAQLLDGTIPVFAPAFFVPAPVVLFKLAAEAPGFPTHVAIAAGNADSGERALALVLAPSRSLLHVVEVGRTAYRLPEPTDTNVRLGDLDFLGRNQDPNCRAMIEGLPVGLAYVGSSTEAGAEIRREQVVVAFDGLASAPGTLALVDVDVSSSGGRTAVCGQVRDTRPIPAGATDVVLRRDGDGPSALRVLVASTATTAVSELTLTANGFGSARSVDALGPTLKLIDAGASGVFALRGDRSAAVWLRLGPSGFERATDLLSSPYDSLDTSELAEPGVISLREPLAVAGAHARLTSLGIPAVSNQFVFVDPEGRDVVLLVHTDGRATYLIGGQRPAIASTGSVGIAEAQSRPVPGRAETLELPWCPGLVEPDMCTPEEVANFLCTSNLLQSVPFSGATTLSVSPHGTLVRGANAAFAFASADLSGNLRAELVDARFDNYGEHRVRLGDSVRVDMFWDGSDSTVHADCFGTTEDVYTRIEATVTRLDVGKDRRGQVVTEGALVGFEGRVAFQSTGNALTSTRAECSLLRLTRDTAELFQIHVPDDLEEVVLAELDGVSVFRVFERAPIVPDPLNPTRRQAEIGFDPDTSSPVRLVVAGSTTSMACSEVPRGFCAASSECGPNRGCLDLNLTCPGQCEEDGARSDRACPTIEMELRGPQVLVDLRTAGGVTSDLLQGTGTVPNDAVFHPQRQSFFVSFPGSRTLVEVPTSPGTPLSSLR